MGRRRRRTVRAKAPHRRLLRIEPLEDRRLLAVATVTTLADTIDFTDGVTSLREAIFATNTLGGADTIEFDAALTAGGPATILLTQGELAITDALTINGPGASLLTVDASGNDPTPDSTLEDGTHLNDGDGSRVFKIDVGDGNSAVIVSIDGLTLTGGDVADAGGAISSVESLYATNVVVAENVAVQGGGIFSGGFGPSTIADCRIEGNMAVIGGGIFAAAADTIRIENVVVSGNTARGPGHGNLVDARRGGGLFFIGFGGEAIVSHSTISNNSADYGGGIANNSFIFADLTLNVEDCVIEGNSSQSAGGGICFVDGGSVPPGIQVRFEVARSVIRGNSAHFSGGGLLIGGVATISDSVIAENSAGGDGGGLIVFVDTNETVTVARTTFERNRGTDGGGIYVYGLALLAGTVQLIDSTLSSNEATRNGGGIYRLDDADWLGILRSTITANRAGTTGATPRAGGGIYNSATFANLTLDHSIVAANSDNSGDGPDLFGGSPQFANVDFSLIGYYESASLPEAPVGSPDANGNLIGGPVNGVIDPLLGPLSYNGGPVFADGSRMLTHALLPGSPALDTGDPTAMAGMNGVPEFDQRGTPWGRVVGGRIDMGAIELQTNPLPGDYNFNGVVDRGDYTVWRNTLGATNDLRADGSGATVGVPDGVVDGLDYDFWKASFGNVLGQGGGAGGHVAASLRDADENRVSERLDHVGASVGDSIEFSLQADAIRSTAGQVRHGESPTRQWHPSLSVTAVRDDALAAWVALCGGNARSASATADLRSETPPTRSEDRLTEETAPRSAVEAAFAGLGAQLAEETQNAK